MGRKYLMEKHKVGVFSVDWRGLKGIPSNNVNEVKHTSLTDCYSNEKRNICLN